MARSRSPRKSPRARASAPALLPRIGLHPLESREVPAVQIVAADPTGATAAAGQPVTFSVLYQTDNPDNKNTGGVEVRLHYDSSKVAVTNVANVFAGGVFSSPADAANRTLADGPNHDTDPATDKFLYGSWLDIIGAAFPGFSGTVTEPIKLYDVTLTPTAAFATGQTTVLRFSGVAATNHTFQAGSPFTLTAGVPNKVPDAVDDSASTAFQAAVEINVLANDTDPDGDALTVTATSAPGNGTAAIANGKVTYTPNAGFTGTDTFTYTISDGKGGTDTATVSVAVGSATANKNPVAANDSASTAFQTAVQVDVLANDSDPDGNALTITGTTNPGNGAVAIGGGKVTYTPNAGFTGTDTFTYTISDGKGGTATGTVTVAVGPQATAGLGKQTAAGAGSGSPQVHVINPDGTKAYTLAAFEETFAGGVRVAMADFNADGTPDVVVGTGPGRSTRVRVIDGKTKVELFAVDPFEASFVGGVYVAAGDLNGDGRPDLVITPDEGGGPRCRVFNGVGFGILTDFFGIEDPNFRGGARPAIGDVNGDGFGDLIVAAGFLGGPRVAGFSGKSLAGTPERVFGDFFAFEQTLRNGVFVACGDLDGDGKAEVIAGGGPGGGPRVTAFSGQALLGNVYDMRANFFGGNPDNRGGIRLAVKNLDNDNRADIVVGSGEGAPTRVTGYLGKDIQPAGTPPAVYDFDPFGNSGGVFVG
jgi:hypothetical protein